jgi:hypothetical protein
MSLKQTDTNSQAASKLKATVEEVDCHQLKVADHVSGGHLSDGGKYFFSGTGIYGGQRGQSIR